MTDDRIPDHLSDGPTIDDADFVLGGFSNQEVTEIHAAVTGLSSQLRGRGPADPIRYFVLGNYDDGRKKWLEQACALLEHYVPDGVAFLLSDLDAENDDWENFYVKFRYVLSFVDYPVVVAEDNDGGHELELGEVSLSVTYVVKRDYESASIDHDVEYEKYDAMMGKLFDVMGRRDHLFEWCDTQSFARALRRVGDETYSRSRSVENGRNVEREHAPTTGPEDELTEYDERELPAEWSVDEDAPEPTGESTSMTTLVRYTYDDEHIYVETVLKTRTSSSEDDYAVEMNVTIKSERRHRTLPVVSGSTYERLQRLAQHLVHVFSQEYERTTDVTAAIERARERVTEDAE